MDLIILLARFAGDILALILLYDFFVQPFRFYGMDPLTRFVWGAARKICAPFETLSRKLIQVPDRDLTPLFALAIVVFCRGLLYAAGVMVSRPDPRVLALGVTLSFQELFTRLAIPLLLFVVYADIQLSRHQVTFIGNVPVMMVHDIAKRFIVLIRKLLPSYRPLMVFLVVAAHLIVFQWALVVVTLLPFTGTSALQAFPPILCPEGGTLIESPLLALPVIALSVVRTFLFGIFILLLLQMLAGFSGLDPYDRMTLILGLVVAPWIDNARKWFPFARVGVIDFSVGILLLILWILLDLLTGIVARIGASPGPL